jgi:hypothetical protein
MVRTAAATARRAARLRDVAATVSEILTTNSVASNDVAPSERALAAARPVGDDEPALAAPIVDAWFEPAERADATPAASARSISAGEAAKAEVAFEPRALTPAVRKSLGLPAHVQAPYRYGFAALMVAIVAAPLLMLHWYWVFAAVASFALGVLPFMRWFERRNVLLAERVYTHGREVIARVVDIEPGNAQRHHKIVRIEFVAERAGRGPARVAAVVIGAPLARRGLEPGDDVVALYDRVEPSRALIVSKVFRDKPKRAARPVPRGGCGAGGCGGCSGGGCGGGGCGGGGCGGGCHE